MANNRKQIVDAIVTLFIDNLDGNSPYVTNVFENVFNKQLFMDEVTDYPSIAIHSAGESREYLPGNFKWAFLTVEIRIYVQDEDAHERLEEIFDDIETIIDANNYLTVDGNNLSEDIRLLSISDDEGLLNPLGVGEMTLEVRYVV